MTDKDNHGGLTDSERRFLTLNPIEWTRNNYPIFCRMCKDELPDLEDVKDTNNIPIKIISSTRVKLHPDKK